MERYVKTCRNCNNRSFEFSGFRNLDPFFGFYGLHIKANISYRGQTKIGRHLGQGIANSLSKLFKKAHRSSISVGYGACSTCTLVSPWSEIADSTLFDFYAGYLTPTYKTERAKFQPGYENIADLHGCDEELNMRQKQHEEYITPHLDKYRSDKKLESLTGLDFGGGTGKIAPKSEWIKMQVYDVGDERLDKDTGEKFDYIQLLHVLEHVGHIRSTLEKAISKAKSGSLIYIEVPWEMSDFKAFSKNDSESFMCDEHINKFCDISVEALIKSLSLEKIICEEGFLNQLHYPHPIRIVRCLAKAP